MYFHNYDMGITCWKNFIAIKTKYVVETLALKKEFFMSAVINKIFIVKYGVYCGKTVI